MPPKKSKIAVLKDSAATRSSPRTSKRKQFDDEDESRPPPKRQVFGDKTPSQNTSFSASFNSADAGNEECTKKPTKKLGKPPTHAFKLDKPVTASTQTDDEPVPDPRAVNGPLEFLEAIVPGSDTGNRFGSNLAGLKSLVGDGRFQEAADLIANKDLWMPSLLAGFASTPVTRLDLSSPKSYGFSIPAFISTELLTPFFAWNKFSQLTTISLRNTPLCLDDLALLRVQLSLTTLDLCNTSITTPELMHLSCHRHTLTSLNIESNDIKDEAWSILAHFPKLAALSLRDTKFTMPGLRWLVKNGIPRGCRLINVPAHAYETLNNREQRYCCNIPDGYVVDPAKVDGLGVPVLKHNLELHAKFGRTSTAGTKIELVHRLRAILDTRLAEEKLLGVLGPKH